MKPFRSKSVWTGIIGAITAVAGAATGTITYGEALPALITSLGTIFVRLGIAKATGADPDAVNLGDRQQPRAGDA
ncbi:MAG TPA: hypothetical protein PLA33_02620 [Ottowia sp.]|nr:hypothetical protein [Ottowia sp.]HNI84323.1 hypothetical protein [Ottowia sp.]HNJ45000.1 hypothetical protein [Ottowia sp.]HNK53235.1 hypothetical protein [Ottowia sp.]HNL40997.1 hypothetical protein [Ottowia sp.]